MEERENLESSASLQGEEKQNLSNSNWKGRFLTISAGQLFSLIGSSAVQFALIWWLAEETGSPLTMAFAGLAAFIPQLVLGPFAGVLIDRMKRKAVIVGADLFIGFVATVFAVVMFFWKAPHWSVFIVLGARGLGNVFHTPAIQAVVPMLVPKEKIVTANGISQFMQSGAFILGPVIGAFLYGAFDLWVILLSDLLGALIAAITVMVVKIQELPQKKEPIRFFSDMKVGFQAFIKDRKLTVVTIASAVGMICFMPLSSYYPLMSSDYFNGTSFHGGMAEMFFAIGMMIGAVLVGGIGVKKNKLGFVRVMFVVLGGITAACGLLPPTVAGFWIFAVLCAGMGGTMNAYNIPYMAYIQETIPLEVQGRAFSFMGSLMSLTMPLGLLISGPIAEKYGVPFWFLVSGIFVVVVTLLSLFIPVKAKTHTNPPPAGGSGV